MLGDIAVLTAGTVISEDVGIKLENVNITMLGRAKKITITKDDTTIVEGAGSKDENNARCSQIKMQIEESTSEYDKEKLQERLAKLSGGVAVIRVGGATEIEVKERKDRVDDAMHATKAAVEEGIVPGGGVALLRAVDILNSVQTENEDQRMGVDVLKHALTAPAQQIACNAGAEGAVTVSRILESKDFNFGYDANKDEYVDMLKAGIIDPTKVVLTALQDAASIAGLVLTTDAAVAEKPEPKPDPGQGAAGQGGMGGMY
jgi:chaperonin GroEL